MATITHRQLAAALAAAVPAEAHASRMPACVLAVLLALRAGALSVGELAALLGWPSATTSDVLALAQGSGWVDDLRPPADLRVRLVQLTPRGRQALRSGRAAKARRST